MPYQECLYARWNRVLSEDNNLATITFLFFKCKLSYLLLGIANMANVSYKHTKHYL